MKKQGATGRPLSRKVETNQLLLLLDNNVIIQKEQSRFYF